MTEKQPIVFAGSGDLGDCIASLPVLRQLGGGTYILCPHPHRAGGPREPMTPKRAAFLLPLLRAQSYISEAKYEAKPQGVTHDFTQLRNFTQKDDSRDTLVDWNAKHAKLTEPVDVSPWIHADPIPEYRGKVVIARSSRYNNHEFPWAKILHHFAGEIVFVGTASEYHKMFNMARGRRFTWARVNDAMDMARVIAGASHFFGNQSFPLWLAMGLGVAYTVECWRASPDVRIAREGARYIFGRKENPDFYRTL